MIKAGVNATRVSSLKPEPRKLIVCIDGTSNQFSAKVNTNVVELYSRITKDSTQLTYYNSGIGTYARPFWWSFAYLKQQLAGIIDLMIAWNFDQVIIGAYRWLADHYQPGDKIFLFGFSRGAYQVRTLAGMIETVGLIHPGNQEQIPFAWALYSGDEQSSVKLKFKEAFCRKDVDLHFVGVWDTVASVGIIPRKPFPLSDKWTHISHFRHALALDECRVKFLPEYIYEEEVKEWLTGENDDAPKSRVNHPSCQEVWFAGTHSDIGGGNKANPTLDRGGEPLKWMMEEAYKKGLSVRLHDVKIGVPHAQVTESMGFNSIMGGFYMLLEIVPFLHWKEHISSTKYRSKWRSHFWRSREVLPSQWIHWTVNASLSKNNSDKSDTKEKSYRPKATILNLNETEEEVAGELAGHSNHKPDVWETFNMNKDQPGLPHWNDDHEFTTMVNILKTRPEHAEEEWFSKLRNYTLGGGEQDESNPRYSSKPDAMWAYGGPQFLQKLFETYGDRDDTVKITRLILGFNKNFEPSSSTDAPRRTNGCYIMERQEEEDEEEEEDPAERLRDMVLPRAILLLEGWVAKDVTPKPHKQNGWGRVKSWFGLSLKDIDPDSVDAQWSWNWIPKETRSVDLVRVVTDILSDAAKTRFAQVMQDASEKLANRIMVLISEMVGNYPTRIESAASWDKKKAALAEGALKVVMALISLGNDAPRDVFHFWGTAGAIRPLICAKEKHPELSLQAMRTTALLIQDKYCGIDVAESGIIPDLIGIMHDYMAEDDPVKQQLVKEASITLEKVTQHTWCCQNINVSEGMEQLLGLLSQEKYTGSILQILKNVSTKFPGQFSSEHVKPISDQMDESAGASLTLANIASSYDFGNTLWDVFVTNKVSAKAASLLGKQDALVQAACHLLRNMLEQEFQSTKMTSKPLEPSVAMPEVFFALMDSLREASRSQLTIDHLLATIVRFFLIKPSPGHEIAASKLEAEIPVLAKLALAGNQQAVLAISAAFARSENNKQRAGHYMLSLIQMIVPEDQKLLKDSTEVITVLINEGYSLQGFHAKGVMDAVIVIINRLYDAQLFASDVYPSEWEEEKVVLSVLSLLEALCIDLDNRNYLSSTGVFKTMIRELGNSSIIYDVKDRVESLIKHLIGYKDLADELKQLRTQVIPDSNDEELAQDYREAGEAD